MSIPFIDPDVQHVRVTTLRLFNREKLRDLNGSNQLLVIHAEDWEPLAVLVPYKLYLQMQKVLEEQKP